MSSTVTVKLNLTITKWCKFIIHCGKFEPNQSITDNHPTFQGAVWQSRPTGSPEWTGLCRWWGPLRCSTRPFWPLDPGGFSSAHDTVLLSSPSGVLQPLASSWSHICSPAQPSAKRKYLNWTQECKLKREILNKNLVWAKNWDSFLNLVPYHPPLWSSSLLSNQDPHAFASGACSGDPFAPFIYMYR